MNTWDNLKQSATEFWQDKYKRKRTIIVAVFAAVFLSVFAFVYFITRPAPNCTDGKQNQNEEGVDCGGVCANRCVKNTTQPLTAIENGFVASGAVNKYDLYSRISNPNNIFGSSSFQYEFKVKDADGQIIATRSGKNYILPGESKYIVENNIETDKVPASVEFNIGDTNWVEFNNSYEKPQLKIVNKQYGPITDGVGFSLAIGLLKNESLFDFSKINLDIILKDSKDNVIGLNSTEMQMVKSGENRDFKALWMNKFPHAEDVINVDVQAEVNVFSLESFSTKYFQSGVQGSSYR